MTCVVDGDTFWLGGEKIRIKNIDAPEISKPDCAAERRLGDVATRRLLTLLNAGSVTLKRQGQDRFGRTLALVYVDGTDVGKVLISEGLAHLWGGSLRSWC